MVEIIEEFLIDKDNPEFSEGVTDIATFDNIVIFYNLADIDEDIKNNEDLLIKYIIDVICHEWIHAVLGKLEREDDKEYTPKSELVNEAMVELLSAFCSRIHVDHYYSKVANWYDSINKELTPEAKFIRKLAQYLSIQK